MRDVVILHKTSRFKFDFADIARRDQRLHVVTLTRGGVALTDDQRAHVHAVHSVGAWTFDALGSVVSGIVAQSDTGADGVLLVTHDEYSMLFAARLRESLGLPGARVEQVLRFTDKPLMKELVAAAGVRVPRWVRVADVRPKGETAGAVARTAAAVVAVTGLPAFAKQVAGTCSEGAVRIDSMAELVDWLERDDIDHDEFEVDEFVTGELLHVDCVVQDGRVVHAQTSLDSFPNAETVSERPLGTLTLPPHSDLGQRMLAFNDSCLAALGPLIDGTTHLEFFDTGRELVFLEVAARSPGGDCPRAYAVQSGVSYQSVFFRIQLGLPVSLDPAPGPWVAWCWYPWRRGRVVEVTSPPIESTHELTAAARPGLVSDGGSGTRDRAVRVFATNHDFNVLARDFDVLRHEWEPVVYAPA